MRSAHRDHADLSGPADVAEAAVGAEPADLHLRDRDAIGADRRRCDEHVEDASLGQSLGEGHLRLEAGPVLEVAHAAARGQMSHGVLLRTVEGATFPNPLQVSDRGRPRGAKSSFNASA